MRAKLTSRGKKAGVPATRRVGSRRPADAEEADGRKPVDVKWNLRLYVAGQTPKSLAAFANLKRLCEEYLPGKYIIEVIDLIENPQLAQGDQILAIPTLIRKIPKPLKRIIGDLSNDERFIVGLDLKRRG